jgi:hypothetical protein
MDTVLMMEDAAIPIIKILSAVLLSNLSHALALANSSSSHPQ